MRTADRSRTGSLAASKKCGLRRTGRHHHQIQSDREDLIGSQFVENVATGDALSIENRCDDFGYRILNEDLRLIEPRARWCR
jgi:hypothetical protein